MGDPISSVLPFKIPIRQSIQADSQKSRNLSQNILTSLIVGNHKYCLMELTSEQRHPYAEFK